MTIIVIVRAEFANASASAFDFSPSSIFNWINSYKVACTLSPAALNAGANAR
jgi:hypothetical protein